MIHIIRGKLLAHAGNSATAEQQYVLANDFEPTGYSWATLAMMYGQQGRLAEKIDAGKHVVELSGGSPGAGRVAVFRGSSEPLAPTAGNGRRYQTTLADLAHGRTLAWVALGDANRAIAWEEEAVRLMPNKPDYWTILADLYDRQGRHDAAQRARERIHFLRQADSPRAEQGGLRQATSARNR